MVIPTPLLGLPKGEGSDSARDYLKGAIGGGGLWHALEVLDNAVMLNGAQTLDGKTFNNATLNSPVINTPTGDVVTPAGTQTLTNKTLTSPAFAGGITTNVGVKVTPAAWNTAYAAVQVGQGLALWADVTGTNARLSVNHYRDAGNSPVALVTGASTRLDLAAGTFVVQTAPSVAGGAVQTFTPRWTFDLNGDLFGPATAGFAAMTDAFVYIPSSGGAPTGVPTNRASNRSPLYFDSVANRFYIYSGASGGWKSVALT